MKTEQESIRAALSRVLRVDKDLIGILHAGIPLFGRIGAVRFAACKEKNQSVLLLDLDQERLQIDDTLSSYWSGDAPGFSLQECLRQHFSRYPDAVLDAVEVHIWRAHKDTPESLDQAKAYYEDLGLPLIFHPEERQREVLAGSYALDTRMADQIRAIALEQRRYCAFFPSRSGKNIASVLRVLQGRAAVYTQDGEYALLSPRRTRIFRTAARLGTDAATLLYVLRLAQSGQPVTAALPTGKQPWAVRLREIVQSVSLSGESRQDGKIWAAVSARDPDLADRAMAMAKMVQKARPLGREDWHRLTALAAEEKSHG